VTIFGVRRQVAALQRAPSMTAESPAQLDLLPASHPLRPVTAEAACWSLGVLLGLLSLSAVVVVWRRAVGALTSPLSPSMLLTAGLMVVVAASCTRLLERRVCLRGGDGRRETQAQQFRWLIALLPSACIVAIGISLSLPGTVATGVLAFWAMLVAEECWAWRVVVVRLSQWRGRQEQEGLSAGTDAPTLEAVRSTQYAAETKTLPSTMLQHFTRSQAADGSEELSGWVRVPFVAGQRTGNAHLAFCPPFATTPELVVEQLDGPRCRIKTVQLLPYGARLELKCAAVAKDPGSVLLRFSANGGGRD
jgi:hypothetical protein